MEGEEGRGGAGGAKDVQRMASPPLLLPGPQMMNGVRQRNGPAVAAVAAAVVAVVVAAESAHLREKKGAQRQDQQCQQ